MDGAGKTFLLNFFRVESGEYLGFLFYLFGGLPLF